MTSKSEDMAASEFNIIRIKEIQAMFAKGENLFVPGRCFIRDGVVTKICRKGPKKRYFFLFDDILVYGTPIKSNLLSQQTILQLSDMGVNSVCHFAPSVDMEFESAWEGLAKEVAFQINHTEKSFHAFAASDSDKENWVRNLTTYIARARESKENSPLAFSPVWLPDIASHTCMLCNTEFTIIKRKHHCRECGRVVCSACSSHEIDLMSMRLGLEPADGKLERVCDRCFVLLQSVQRKDRGGTGKKPEAGKPRRPTRPPSVLSAGASGGVAPKKPPPPKPAPYASTKKAPSSTPTANDTGKRKESEESDLSDPSSDDGETPTAPLQHGTDFASLHQEFSPSSLKRESEEIQQLQQAVLGREEDGKTKEDSALEPYPAVVKGNESSAKVEPEKQSLAAKKAVFASKLIEVKNVSPVAAPRKSRKEGSEAVEPDIENDKESAVVGVCDETAPSKSDTPPTESASVSHQPKTTPPQPKPTPPQPETELPQSETTSPQSDIAPPQSETTPTQSETTPPQSGTTPIGTEAADHPDSFTKQEAASRSVQAPPRRKRASKFTGTDVKAPPISDSPPPQKNGEKEEEKKEIGDVEKQSAAETSHGVKESDVATAVRSNETSTLSVQKQQIGEVLDTGGVDPPAQEELPLGSMEKGSAVVVGGESISGPADSLEPSVLDDEVVQTGAKKPAVEDGLSGREPVGGAEVQALAEAKQTQENQRQSSPTPKKARGRRNKFAS